MPQADGRPCPPPPSTVNAIRPGHRDRARAPQRPRAVPAPDRSDHSGARRVPVCWAVRHGPAKRNVASPGGYRRGMGDRCRPACPAVLRGAPRRADRWPDPDCCAPHPGSMRPVRNRRMPVAACSLRIRLARGCPAHHPSTRCSAPMNAADRRRLVRVRERNPTRRSAEAGHHHPTGTNAARRCAGHGRLGARPARGTHLDAPFASRHWTRSAPPEPSASRHAGHRCPGRYGGRRCHADRGHAPSYPVQNSDASHRTTWHHPCSGSGHGARCHWHTRADRHLGQIHRGSTGCDRTGHRTGRKIRTAGCPSARSAFPTRLLDSSGHVHRDRRSSAPGTTNLRCGQSQPAASVNDPGVTISPRRPIDPQHRSASLIPAATPDHFVHDPGCQNLGSP